MWEKYAVFFILVFAINEMPAFNYVKWCMAMAAQVNIGITYHGKVCMAQKVNIMQTNVEYNYITLWSYFAYRWVVILGGSHYFWWRGHEYREGGC